MNLDELLGRIAELLRRLIDYQMFSILLLDPSGEKLQHRFSLRFNENIHLKHEVPLGRGMVGHAAQTKAGDSGARRQQRSPLHRGNPETRSELAVPLIYKDKVIGVLDLEHTRRGFFTEDHQRTMMTLAAQVAIAIENARLYEEIARQERRLERDLALARELQMRLASADAAEAGASGTGGKVCSRASHRRRSLRFHSLLAFAPGNCDRRCQRQRRAGGYLCGAGQRDFAVARAH